MPHKALFFLVISVIVGGMSIGCIEDDDEAQDGGMSTDPQEDGGDEDDGGADPADSTDGEETDEPEGTEETDGTDDSEGTEETDGTEDETDSTVDYEYDYDYADYLEMKQVIKNYDVVAYSAGNIESKSLSLQVGSVSAKTSPAASNTPAWDEVLMHGSAEDIAGTWVVDTGDAKCEVAVTKEMVEQWGGFAVNQCGDASQIAFHFVPIN